MQRPDYAAAEQYVVERLKNELDPRLVYHSIEHTCADVAPAIERLAALEGIGAEDTHLLRTAALYHDVGYIELREGHELVSVSVVRAALPTFGFAPAQVEQISAIILATRLPQTPADKLGELMADADLDGLGRNDFFIRNSLLRTENSFYGGEVSDADWYNVQLKFLSAHNYFTNAAWRLRQQQKEQNVAQVRELLRRAETAHVQPH